MKGDRHDLELLSQRFRIAGEFFSARPFGSGHINDTYLAEYKRDGRIARYVHQRINANVFKEPWKVMDNVERVLRHVRAKLRAENLVDPDRYALKLVPTATEDFWITDEAGNYWRTYLFIEEACTYDSAQSPAMAREAARAFGRFQSLIADLPGTRLHDTIPDFHNTRKRYKTFTDTLKCDKYNRANNCQTEINFVLSHEELANALLDLFDAGKIPERITHNDTKLNNVMFDKNTGEAVCVIDLDTIMPGLAAYDFGDMVRTSTCFSEEDERDLSKVKFEMPMFEAITDGYFSEACNYLNSVEQESMNIAGQVITFETGMRFLTDHLDGDNYFRIHRDGHNLDRCRTQFELVRQMELNFDKMKKTVSAARLRYE